MANRTPNYIIVGKYDCERYSWLQNGDIRHVVSTHRTARGAWSAVYKAEKELNNIEGGNPLTQVMVLLPKEKEAHLSEGEDYYEYKDRIYVRADFWDDNEIAYDGRGFVARPRK